MNRIDWQIINGSGWNHHKTADALKHMDLPAVPVGYGVLVAPISDKPFGLRCALVKVLGRKVAPSISIHEAGGNYLPHPAVVKYDHLRMADVGDMATAAELLAANGYWPTTERPPVWPGRKWYRHDDGTWASVELLDDGSDGDADHWARERFGVDVEIIKSVRVDQQSDDDSGYLIRSMAEAISRINAEQPKEATV